MVYRLISSKTAASKLLPIEIALKTDILSILAAHWQHLIAYEWWEREADSWSTLFEWLLVKKKIKNNLGGRGETPDKSDPRTLKCPIIGHIWV